MFHHGFSKKYLNLGNIFFGLTLPIFLAFLNKWRLLEHMILVDDSDLNETWSTRSS